MIVCAAKLPASKPMPAPAPKPAPEASAVEKALMALPAALAGIKPAVTVQTPPRLNEWVFHIQRNAVGQIESINAKGAAK